MKRLFLVGALVICLAFAALLLDTPAQGVEVPLPVAVTVVSPTDESYGASVYAADRCGNPSSALGKPDGRGAALWSGGSVTIELERTISDCETVSIWAAKGGLGSGKFRVYVSEDAGKWTELGGRTATPRYKTYDFGRIQKDEVRYIRVEHNGSWFAVVLLDAALAKGGDD